MNKILTVTVPAYNMEKYLEQNLRSFVHVAIMDKIEILIVDDGSKDGTAEIGRRYQEQFPDTFRLISKENGGHGSTINVGLSHARGKYFKVVDADDWVDTENFVQLVKVLSESESDCIINPFVLFNNMTLECEQTPAWEGTVENRLYLYNDVAKSFDLRMHEMTVKTSIYTNNNIAIDEHCFYVDIEYVVFAIPYIETVLFLHHPVYYYRIFQIDQSIGTKARIRNFDHEARVFTSLMKRYQSAVETNSKVTMIKKEVYFSRMCKSGKGAYGFILMVPLRTPQARAKLVALDDTARQNQALYSAICRISKEKKVSSLPSWDLDGLRISILRKTNFHCWYIVSLACRCLYKADTMLRSVVYRGKK